MTVLRSGSASDVGRIRAVNEDMAFAASPLYGVADGMGGHVGGDIAARIAVDAFRSAFQAQPTVDGLIGAVQEANGAVWERGRVEPDLRGMGTTLTAAALVEGEEADGDHLVLVNVGDSRAYRLRRGTLEQLTTDHSVAEELAARGELTPEEAALHPHRHILTRVLGVAPHVDVDAWELSPQVGDRYMVCSDGFSNEVGPDEMKITLESVADPETAAHELVRLANDAGGNDNITVVIFDVEELDAPVQDQPADEGATGYAKPDDDIPPVPLTRSAMLAGGNQRGTGTIALERAPALTLGDDLLTGTQKALLEPAADSPGTKSKRRAAAKSRGTRSPAQKGQRVVTFRLFLFIIVVAAVLVGAWGLVRWYFDNSYFLGVEGKQVVVEQGKPGGFLWLNPKTVQRTGVTTAGVPANQVVGLRNGTFTASSESAARSLLRHMVLAQCDYEQGVPGPTSTTAPPPGTPSIALCPHAATPQVSPPPTTSTTIARKSSGGSTGSTSTSSPTSTTTSHSSTSSTAKGGTG